ncbi:flagellar protein [Sulfurimonas sediminis]|uniref:Flagellar protein n=1 Tax=Sulfurimonas sediminis TaxID=2590020 RepID=A0A7M1B3K3_9BACT|nr:flagellar protein [Sulfurimonas sediminis]QOP44319.1 flagellar protein [Sulfurimonas sediminis]
MLKWILLAFVLTNSFALEISIESAKDNFIKYSTLDIRNTERFTCKEIKNDLDTVLEVQCIFLKRPVRKLKHIQNDFFKVNTVFKDEKFIVTIKPFYKIKLIPEIFDLTKDNEVFDANVTYSDHWSVLGYKKTFPLFKQEEASPLALDFPFYLDKDKLPYVGSLDLQGNPVYIKNVEDVKEYLKVKKYYKHKEYELCLESIDDILNDYPNTLFKAELLYYKIKVYAKIKDWDNVVSVAKEFLREYSSDENVAEVLSLVAKAYAKLGENSNADYFYDRLFTEHPQSKFTQLGYIYKGEMLEESGGTKQALKYYKKALYETKDLEVAANAAYHLASLYLSFKPKEASKYAMKIIQADPGFFMEDFKASQKMMEEFANQGYYKVAAAIADTLLQEIDATYDEYEELLKNKALWLAQTKEKKKALAALNEYLKKFPDGDYVDAVQVAKDALFFEVSDLNATAKLAEFDKLIQEYQNDTIGKRALYEKAKLLLEEGKYKEVLSLKKSLEALDKTEYKDIQKIIQDAAIGEMKQSLRKKNCKQVLIISNEYNITLSDKWDDGIYECAMKGGDFQLSKSIAGKNLKSKDLDERKKWLYRYIKVDFATGNYSDVLDAAKDLITLIEDDKNSKYKEVYRYLFDTYERLEQKEKMIDAMAKIEELFGLDYKDTERYVAMVTLGNERHDDNLIIKYAKKVMQIQNKSNSYAQSPYVEFALYQAYMDKKEYNRALEVIKSLDKLALSPTLRARQKYLLGSVLDKLWRDDAAKKAYKEAIAADPKSSWAKLAKSALEL